MAKPCSKMGTTKASPRPLFNFQNLVPDSFLILVINPKNHWILEIILKIRYFERGLSKSLKKVNFFFRTQSLLMHEVIKNERGLELVTTHPSRYETSSDKLLY